MTSVVFSRPYGTHIFRRTLPSDKSLGYFQKSPTGLFRRLLKFQLPVLDDDLPIERDGAASEEYRDAPRD